MIPGYVMPRCSDTLSDTLACGHSPHSILGAFQLKLPPPPPPELTLHLQIEEMRPLTAQDLYGAAERVKYIT